ncbi:hypothetical protein ACJWDR_02350 [Streptomyces tauricus]|uniref:hypothetical protein n=1 Tax=Streptomyces tauricus TaxID=68274 RepID=UPI00387F029F
MQTRKVTGFTDTEEGGVQLTDVVPFLVGDWEPYVVQDGLLITGQNPASSGPAADTLIALTTAQAGSGRIGR